MYADVKLNFDCMHWAGRGLMPSLCECYDLYELSLIINATILKEKSVVLHISDGPFKRTILRQ